MTTPRLTVRDHWLEKLATILKKNQYHTDVVTVERKSRLATEISLDECPAIIVGFGPDRPFQNETVGANNANQHFREREMELILVMPTPGSEQELEDAGELFLADVQRCLLKNRFGNNGKPSDVRFDIQSSEFERIENNKAQYVLNVGVRYDFTVSDLQQ